MDTTEALEKIGLEEREAKVYLAVLELNESTVLPIAKKSGIERTYCYPILETLGEKGLVSFVEKNGRRRYSAAPPKTLKSLLVEKLNDFDKVLPDLEGLYKGSAARPRVRYFEGENGIRSLYEEVLGEAKEVWFLGSISDLTENLPDFSDYVKRQIRAKIKIRDLVRRDDKAVEISKTYKKPNQEMRFLPKGVSFATDNMIWNDKVVMVSYGQDLHAVSIESPEIAQTQKAIFELAWRGAEKVNPVRTDA